MLYDMIVELIGVPPAGWEFYPYILAGFLFLFGLYILWQVVSIPFTFMRNR